MKRRIHYKVSEHCFLKVSWRHLKNRMPRSPVGTHPIHDDLMYCRVRAE